MAVITISRLPGAPSETLAPAMAERLSYRLVGRDELIHLAGSLGGVAALERSPELRERSPTFWERLQEERHRYGSVLRNVVTGQAEDNNVVIVGLGAGQLLRGLHHVLRLQVVAPLEFRIQRVMREGLDETPGPVTREQARDLLRRRERDAAGYMRYLFNIDWNDPQYWDMVVNTGRFEVGEVVEFAASMVENGLLEPANADRQRLADMALASRVEAMLLNDPGVWISGLKVSVDRGRVQIEGEVLAEDDRDTAEEIVRRSPGVLGVENNLGLQPPPLTGM